jgi:hypothetical protein
MPNIYKILGQVNPTANTQGNVYVVPAATSSVINSITVANQNTTTNASYSIAVMPSANFASPASNGQYYIIRGSMIPAGDAATLTLSLSLPAGTVVAANTNSANVSFSAFGVEIT